MRKLLLVGLVALLPGCSAIESLFNGTPVSQQEIAATENGFIAADKLAMAYMTLPVCAVPKPTSGPGAVCADPAVKAVIKAKEQVAYNAFTTFQSATAAGSSADMAALDAAIGSMVASIPTPTVATK